MVVNFLTIMTFLAMAFTKQANDLPLVSIVISSNNRGQFLDIGIQSALNQTYPNTEIIIVDDGSHDVLTKRIIEFYADKYPEKIRVQLQHINLGSSATKNMGYYLAKGPLVAIFEDDDVSLPDIIK